MVNGVVEIVGPVPNTRKIVPVMDGLRQEADPRAEATLDAVPADAVVEGTPIDLRRVMKLKKPIANVTYELDELEPGRIGELVDRVLGG